MKTKMNKTSPPAKGTDARRGGFVLELMISDMASGIERIERHYLRGDLTIRMETPVGNEVPIEIGGVKIRSTGSSFEVARAENSWLRGRVDSTTGLGQAVGVLVSTAQGGEREGRGGAPEMLLFIRLTASSGRVECYSDFVSMRLPGHDKAVKVRVFFKGMYRTVGVAARVICQITAGWFADWVCEGGCVPATKQCVIFRRKKGSEDEWEKTKWTWIYKADPDKEYRCGCV